MIDTRSPRARVGTALGGGALALFLLAGCASKPETAMTPTPEASSSAPAAAEIPAETPEANARLFDAVAANNPEAIAQALADGANLESRNDRNQTPVIAATKSQLDDAAEALILAGADVNAKDDLQDSAYLYAGAEGYNRILELTIAHGAELESVNRYGGTAIIPAAEHGYADTIQILLDAGINPNHINNPGWTALQEAVLLGTDGENHQESVRRLIAGGADVNLRDKRGSTPLNNALNNGFSNLAALISAAGGHR
ncbi:ankyrin repeat domain-containing protein [Mycetocola spongiae]|uniref:ankyrin repeat domain-containing protein n=1 Tax=Mycetocola spongiae TaxID=2859226 RepID=UPI001CF5BFDA|nr:ankyrin repeat domain-containing protein [Mycetocola spongiae]UCR88980.1 ankyrin repeat domain-containing protein [Mycetocola spongiae]